MPIYEYEAKSPAKSCPYCRTAFEVIQGLSEKDLRKCPQCGGPVRKVVSWCQAAVVEASEEYSGVMSRVKEHERAGRHSHAAELADKVAAETRDRDLKTRALDNYAKAGYDAKTLNKHDSGED